MVQLFRGARSPAGPLRPLAWALLAIAVGCQSEQTTAPDNSAQQALAVAQHFVDAYYHAFPEEAFEVGYPDTPMDRLGDRSGDAMATWRALEDGWLDTLRAIDPASLEGTEAAIPYAFTLDRLEASVGRRVCRGELWNVSPTWTGWQSMLASTFAVQPVATAEERAAVRARLSDVPRYLRTEIQNLREGVASGHTASRASVDAVIRQVHALLTAPPEDSPFYAPAAASEDEAFRTEVRRIVVDEIRPLIAAYGTLLAEEYTPRDDVGVSANPNGADCYQASTRFHTSLLIDGADIQATGLREMDRIETEMLEIARRSFGTDDVPALLERLRTDPQFTFRSEAEVLAYAQAAVDRGREAMPQWFGFVPDAAVILKPFPAYQQASGGGFYAAGALDGSRPGTYELGTYQPETISKAGMEATAFHETYPGHHQQFSVALFGGEVHPVLRYVYVPGMAEGWGLYTERLADEMGLYSSDMDRLGLLSNEALRAARLVVDPGMHVLGWSRERAIEYMLSHTAESRGSVESEIDRYIAVPGQATSYLLGSLEIQRLRAVAEERLGDRFDIRTFHDRVLGDGAVSLPMLEAAIDRWVAEMEGG